MKFGYTVIWVDDVVKTVEFYEKAFGLVRRTLVDKGQSIWAEIETGKLLSRECYGFSLTHRFL